MENDNGISQRARRKSKHDSHKTFAGTDYPPSITESELKQSICAFLERVGGDRVLFTVTPPKRTKYSSRFMRAGWSDIYGCLQTQVVPRGYQPLGDVMKMTACIPFFIEVKKPGGALSLEQHKILERAKAMGAITCVATCLEDVRKALRI